MRWIGGIVVGAGLLLAPVGAHADGGAALLVAEITAGPRALTASAEVAPSQGHNIEGSYTFTVGEQLAAGDWTLVGRLRTPGAQVFDRSVTVGSARTPAGADDLAAGAVLARVGGREPGALHRGGVVASGSISFPGGEAAGAALEMTLFQ